MPISNNSMPAPAPDNAGGNPVPNLSVVPAAPKRRAPGALNEEQIQQLNKSDLITTAALKYQAGILKEGVTLADINSLVGDTLATRRCSHSAVCHTKAKEGATLDLQSTRKDLMRELRRAQAKAKKAYLFSEPTKLGEYYVGERIDESRATLEQTSQDIIDQTNADRPSGTDTAFINRMELARAAWIAARNAQTNEKSDAKTVRAQRDTEVASITDRRIQLQLAADAQWPAGVEANAGIRAEFLLQPNRPLKS